jgi:hypothetical protein
MRLLRARAPVAVASVAATENEANDMVDRLRAASVEVRECWCLAGFSETIGDRKLDPFFSL